MKIRSDVSCALGLVGFVIVFLAGLILLPILLIPPLSEQVSNMAKKPHDIRGVAYDYVHDDHQGKWRGSVVLAMDSPPRSFRVTTDNDQFGSYLGIRPGDQIYFRASKKRVKGAYGDMPAYPYLMLNRVKRGPWPKLPK